MVATPRLRRDVGIPTKHAPSSNRTAWVIPQFLVRMSVDNRRRDCPMPAVVMVRVVVALPLLASVTCVGLKLHVASAGNPEHAKFPTVPVSPFELCRVRVTFCDCPAVTEMPPWGKMVKSGMLIKAHVFD